jgi:S-adenosylmethionine hydrolase
MERPVSLLTDFGLDDEFVGVIHGVILRIDPEARIVDVTHGIPRGDVRAGALALLRAIQYLPGGVVMAVVDPGVGTARRAIAAATPWGHFVGPDNGLLAPAVAMVGGATSVVSLENPAFRLARTGVTFDGRDVFAPAAAALASGQAQLGDLGPPVSGASLMPLLLPLVEVEAGVARGEVWWVDRFGNAQTNVTPEDLRGLGLAPGDTLVLTVGATHHELPWTTAYGEGESPGVVHTDSHGMIAVAVPGGRADEAFNLRAGVAVGFRAPEARGGPLTRPREAGW